MSTRSAETGQRVDRQRLILVTGALIAVELLLLALYFTYSSHGVLSPRYVLYPFVWINTAVVAVLAVDRPRATRRKQLLALGVAGGYLALVAWFDGTVSIGSGTGALRLLALAPGWGPALIYDGSLRLVLFPFKTVGYLTLAYLVYGLVVEAAGSGLVGGAVGLLSCVSCTLPVAAAVVSGVVGGTVGVTAATGVWSYDLSTLAFVLAVGLLAWRPRL